MITIYTVAYNEAMLLQFMIDHYRSRFPNCKIILYDNMSTDNTQMIAKENNCEIISYDTNNQIKDSKYLEIKNQCWKTASTDWVLICDVDELFNITESDLKKEEFAGTTIIQSEGFNMINMKDNCNLSEITCGIKSPQYNKTYLFNKKYIDEINYSPGCHICTPVGNIKLSKTVYPAYHYKYINLNFQIARYTLYASRLSSENKQNHWGCDYLFTEAQIRNQFSDERKKASEIIKSKFTQDWFSSCIPNWEKELKHLVGKENLNFLEIGSFEGRSACWLLQNVLTHSTSRITCIDTFPEGLESSFNNNIFRINRVSNVDKRIGESQSILRALPLNFYDFIYIDGSHKASDVLEDAVISWRLLKQAGILIFDDYEWAGATLLTDKPKLAIDAFLRCFQGQYDVLHKQRQVIIRKR